MVASTWTTALVLIAIILSGHEILKIVASRSTSFDPGFGVVVVIAVLIVVSTHLLVNGLRAGRRRRRG